MVKLFFFYNHMGVEMKVFFSHSEKDFEEVQVISQVIEDEGHSVYLAEDNPAPGKYVEDKLRQEISTSDFMIILCTANSQTSSIIEWEVDTAQSLDKVVVPLKLGNNCISWMLEGLEYIDLEKHDWMWKLQVCLEQQQRFKNIRSLAIAGVIVGVASVIGMVFSACEKKPK